MSLQSTLLPFRYPAPPVPVNFKQKRCKVERLYGAGFVNKGKKVCSFCPPTLYGISAYIHVPKQQWAGDSGTTEVHAIMDASINIIFLDVVVQVTVIHWNLSYTVLGFDALVLRPLYLQCYTQITIYCICLHFGSLSTYGYKGRAIN